MNFDKYISTINKGTELLNYWGMSKSFLDEQLQCTFCCIAFHKSIAGILLAMCKGLWRAQSWHSLLPYLCLILVQGIKKVSLTGKLCFSYFQLDLHWIVSTQQLDLKSLWQGKEENNEELYPRIRDQNSAVRAAQF